MSDRDFILFQLRKISIEESIRTKHKCSNCGVTLYTEIHIDEFPLVKASDEDVLKNSFPFELPVGIKWKGAFLRNGEHRWLTGRDQNQTIQIPNPAKKISAILSAGILRLEDIKIITHELVVNMVSRDRDYLFNKMYDETPGIKLKVETVCDKCGEALEVVMGIDDFLAPSTARAI